MIHKVRNLSWSSKYKRSQNAQGCNASEWVYHAENTWSKSCFLYAVKHLSIQYIKKPSQNVEMTLLIDELRAVKNQRTIDR
jgi:hypothetical protein